MIEKLKELNDGWKAQGKQPLDIGVGLCTGVASVGNMGSELRYGYTALGDIVNLSSRVEGLNKEYGTHIIISEGTYGEVREEFVCRELDLIRVKGKLKPVKIFELVGTVAEMDQHRDRIDRFHCGLEAYRQGLWATAAEIFEALTPQAQGERRQSKLGAYGCLDGLTGLLNHSMIQAHLKENLSLHLVYPIPFCVMCFAIDQLPELRKRYGQAGVDAALRAVAQTLENGLRPTDFLGRWMENEFLGILPECNESDVIKVGDRLGRLVRNSGVPWWGDKMRVTVSMGATAALDNDTVGSIVSRAERALKECTDAGGNRVVMVTA
jgi:diguanylate cyclase (GGDEF)-like protein